MAFSMLKLNLQKRSNRDLNQISIWL